MQDQNSVLVSPQYKFLGGAASYRRPKSRYRGRGGDYFVVLLLLLLREVREVIYIVAGGSAVGYSGFTRNISGVAEGAGGSGGFPVAEIFMK